MTHRNICFDICFAFPDGHSCVIRRSLSTCVSVFTSSLPSILFLLKVSWVWACHMFMFFLRVSITLFSQNNADDSSAPHCCCCRETTIPAACCFDLQLRCSKSSNKVMDLNNLWPFKQVSSTCVQITWLYTSKLHAIFVCRWCVSPSPSMESRSVVRWLHNDWTDQLPLTPKTT